MCTEQHQENRQERGKKSKYRPEWIVGKHLHYPRRPIGAKNSHIRAERYCANTCNPERHMNWASCIKRVALFHYVVFSSGVKVPLAQHADFTSVADAAPGWYLFSVGDRLGHLLVRALLIRCYPNHRQFIFLGRIGGLGSSFAGLKQTTQLSRSR